MLQIVSDLHGREIRATDGEIGNVDQWFFDDETWTIRYLVVDTGNWLPGRQVLISPIALGETDWVAEALNVSLTKKQIKNSPGIDADKPVSREHVAEHSDYYGYPHYWRGRSSEGASLASRMTMGYPDRIGVATGYAATPAVAPAIAPPEERGDPHLRSTKALIGYYIEAKDGSIGHVQDFIVDDQTWAIRYMVVDTVNWWPGKKVVISPQWIERVSWEESKVFVDLSRESIKKAPEYNPAEMLSRQYEDGLYGHYSRPNYWDRNDAGHVNEAFSPGQFSGTQPAGNGDRLERKVAAMDKQKLHYFRELLLEQLRTATEDVRAAQTTALQGDDGVKDTGDMSELDVNKSTAFNLGERQLQMVEEIDQALLRIEEGTYGQCGHCSKPIDEERLKAMPSAKYDAECQMAIEATLGIAEMPTL